MVSIRQAPLVSVGNSASKYRSLGDGEGAVRLKDHRQNSPARCEREDPEAELLRMGKRVKGALVFVRGLVSDLLSKETGGHSEIWCTQDVSQTVDRSKNLILRFFALR